MTEQGFAASPAVPSAKLPGPIAILKSAWRIYVNRFWVLVCISLAPAILVGVFLAVGAGAVATGDLFGLISLNAGVALDVAIVLLAVLAYIAVIYVGIWSQAALMFGIKGADEKVGFKQSFHAASHKIGSMFGALVLVVAIVCLGMLACCVGLRVLYFVANLLFHSTTVNVILAILGFVFVGIVALTLAIRYSLASYIVVGDDATAMSAVKRSRDYVRGYWWPVFWRLVFLVAMTVVLVLAVVLLIALLGFLLKGAGLAGTILILVVNEVLTLAISLLCTVYSYQVYANLKAVKGESQVPADKKAGGWIVLAVVLGFILLLGVPISLLALNSARAKARDQKRVADVQEVSTALELYKINKGSYPSDLSQLVSAGYLGAVPTAPTPADGNCTAAENSYSYTLIDPTEYEFTFCTDGNPHTMTENGISSTADSNQ